MYEDSPAIILRDEENAVGPHHLLMARSNGKTQRNMARNEQ